jgi:hypothetical protein
MMSTLEHEVIEKFHQLDKAAQKRCAGYLRRPRRLLPSGSPLVVMVQTTQNRDTPELRQRRNNQWWWTGRDRDLSVDALMRTRVIEVTNVRCDLASQIALALGAPIGVRITSMSVPAATRSNRAPYFPSLSRMRKRGPAPNGVASRSCWATHASLGERVTPKCTTRRDPNSTMKKTKIVRKNKSYVCTKSQTQISSA